VDVLLTHEPPRGVLDGGYGCKFLAQEVAAARPRVHVFGHVHEHSGSELRDGVLYVNAALANDGMKSKGLDAEKFVYVVDVAPHPSS
jgi:Icc-related predicted phosphoesterase